MKDNANKKISIFIIAFILFAIASELFIIFSLDSKDIASILLLLMPAIIIGVLSNDLFISNHKIRNRIEVIFGYIFAYGIILCVAIYLIFKEDYSMGLIAFILVDIIMGIIYKRRDKVEDPGISDLNRTNAILLSIVLIVFVVLTTIVYLIG